MIGMAGFAASLMVIAVIISPCVYGKDLPDQREIQVQKLLKRLNKPALKSIKSGDGDIIDCVPITTQPALDHPLLKNHTIQMRPSFIPKGDHYTKKDAKAITQVWHQNGECPQNTVAIRRTTREEILRAKTIESFGKKTHQSTPGGHEHAIMDSGDGRFYGTQFAVNMWRPEVEVPSELSLAQTWLWSDSDDGLNTIEAGWQVYPGMYGDNNLRLFVYWTANGYQPGSESSGCYNHACSGFVQRSNRITVGGSLSPMSNYDGGQYSLPHAYLEGTYRRSNSLSGDNWWLMIRDELVGYWPGSLFNSLRNEAKRVQWGGEIVNMMTGGRHTDTDMGSGHFADEGFKKASYFRNIMTVDGANTLREPQRLSPWAAHGNCYNVKPGNGGTSFGNHFYFGGPGRNGNCP
ncbi:hypothetical protein CARUB_v10024866mg [Capsella rubella]|uniref:Neprosin PEP catalytic domain-containing protein n=1 Tax=Capsella rubella TaxID=81985 RepID=R0HG46_9BRAS|nr:hypothetical protein CARUB_v10024866mg [Capsella rubella]